MFLSGGMEGFGFGAVEQSRVAPYRVDLSGDVIIQASGIYIYICCLRRCDVVHLLCR